MRSPTPSWKVKGEKYEGKLNGEKWGRNHLSDALLVEVVDNVGKVVAERRRTASFSVIWGRRKLVRKELQKSRKNRAFKKKLA